MEHGKPPLQVDLARSLNTNQQQPEPKATSRRDFLTRTAAATVVAAASPLVIAADKYGRDRDWTGNDPVTYPEPAWEVKDKRLSGR